MLTVVVVLLIVWLLAVFAFQVTNPLIHAILVASLITLVMALLRRKR